MKDCRLMINKPIEIQQGIPAHLTVFNGIFSDGNYIYAKQICCIYKGVMYMLIYMGEAGKPDPYKYISGDILNSFKPGEFNGFPN